MLGFFLLFIVLLSGLVAYTADTVARKAGRRHIRLFGLRPKTTALVIAMLTGMGISLLSVLGFALLNQEAIRTISRAEEVRRELNTLKAELTPLKLSEKSLRESKTKLTAELETQRRELSSLKDSEEALRRSKNNLTLQLTQTTQQLRELNATFLPAAQQKPAIQSSNLTAALRLESEVLQKNLKTLQDTKNRLQQEAVTLKTQNETFQTDFVKAQAELKSLNTAVVQVKTKNSELLKLKNDLAQRYQVLQASNATAQERSDTLTSQNNTLLGQLKSQQKELKAAQEMVASYQPTVTKYQKELKSLSQSKADAQNEVNGLLYLKGQLQADSTKLTADNNRLQAELQKSMDEQKVLQKSIEELQRSAQDLKTTLAKQGNELSTIRTQKTIYNKGDLIYQTVLDNDFSTARVSQAIKQAEQKAYGSGARGKPALWVGTSQLNAALNRLSQIPDSAVLLFRASQNTSTGVAVEADVQVLANEVIYKRTQPIRNRIVALGTSNSRSAQDLSKIINELVASSVEVLVSRGIPPENIRNGGLSAAEVADLINRLRALKGNVNLAIASQYDVRPSDTVVLYPVILR